MPEECRRELLQLAQESLSVESSSVPTEKTVPITNCQSFSAEHSSTDLTLQSTGKGGLAKVSEGENGKRIFGAYKDAL